MASNHLPTLKVSDFLVFANQTLEGVYPVVEVEGEVASLVVRQNKFVFFDLKDETGSLNCFMLIWHMRVALSDGMKVIVRTTPRLTDRGKFSLTVRDIRPVGQGSIKKNFELLRDRLMREGLFAPERKRQLPAMPSHIAVISSLQAAGYADFMKIINQRWGGMRIDVLPVPVQGSGAADRIIWAIEYCNSMQILPQIIVIIRGGGSADDLSVFNDERLVRAIAASRVPTVVGVGHEIDETLADYAADVRAATPSNAAQLITPDITNIRAELTVNLHRAKQAVQRAVDDTQGLVHSWLDDTLGQLHNRCMSTSQTLASLQSQLRAYNPDTTLARGYALVRGQICTGQKIIVERYHDIITAEVIHVQTK